MQVSFRRANSSDAEHVRWALYTALAWNPERERLVRQVTIEHPEAARYHHGWGRPGDLGIIGADASGVVGVCYCRLFTEADHGHGYVDDQTPELTVAVREDRRGRGLGTRLLNELARAAREAGFTSLSLSVDSDNPARQLYERVGYRQVSADESGVRMVLEIATSRT